MDIQLPLSEEHPLVKGSPLRIGRYYRLQAANLPTIDSLFFIHPLDESSPILLTFRITRNGECHVNGDTLRSIDKLNFPSHTNIRKFVVAVTPDGVDPKIKIPNTSSEGTGEKRRRDKKAPEEPWRAFHYPVSMEKLFPHNEDR